MKINYNNIVMAAVITIGILGISFLITMSILANAGCGA